MLNKIGLMPLTLICILVLLWFDLSLSGNAELELCELKAHFRQSVYIEFSDYIIDDVWEIRIGGVASSEMTLYDYYSQDYAVYNTKERIDQIIQYLSTTKFAKSGKNEVPNISCDSSIYFYDENGEAIKRLLLYGTVFIQDIDDNNKIYRIKNTNKDIIHVLNKVLR